jgi:hypothetical protein
MRLLLTSSGFQNKWLIDALRELLAKPREVAKTLNVPMYAIDDQTAIKVVDGVVEVITAGEWKKYESKVTV